MRGRSDGLVVFHFLFSVQPVKGTFGWNGFGGKRLCHTAQLQLSWRVPISSLICDFLASSGTTHDSPPPTTSGPSSSYHRTRGRMISLTRTRHLFKML